MEFLAKEIVLKRTIELYRAEMADETFNGIKLEEMNKDFDDATLRAAIVDLVTDRKIDLICSETQLNPHIKRHPAQPIEIQLEHLDVREKYHTCLYPTAETIAEEYDLKFLDQKPFSQQIAKGRPQLEPIFFEIGVLDRYRLDPRYDFQCDEYAGRLSISSSGENKDNVPERDQIFLQTFGLGLDEGENAHVCVFLRYLSQLTPDHQRHWQTYVAQQPARMHINYYKPSYLGEFYENNSAINALRFSIDSINTVCKQVWGVQLFRNSVPKSVHHNLSPFMRAAKADYLSFALELDKIISENINQDFFDGKLDLHQVVRHPDGTIERQRKGTLTLLDEWLFSGEINWRSSPTEARREVIQPLRRVRRERQSAAHTIIKNEFDPKYIRLKREVLIDAAFALGNILFVLTTHPRSPKIRIPAWFEEGRIEAI